MSRRIYTDEEKLIALQYLALNRNQVEATAALIGVPRRTLARWKRLAVPQKITRPMPMPSNTGETRPIPPPMPLPPLSPDALNAFHALQRRMMDEANILLASIHESIPEASLGQRAIAFARILDRAFKLAAELPADDLEADDDPDQPTPIDEAVINEP